MTDEILNGIKSVFKHDYDLLLSPQEIYESMRLKDFFKSIEYKKAMVEISIRLRPPAFFHRKVSDSIGITKDGWMLAHHFRVADFKENQHDDLSFQLQIGKEFQRTISAEGTEIESGTIPLRGDFDSFYASMDMYQQRQKSIDVGYYADENATCKVEQDEHDHWFLKSAWLKEWYKENQIEPGDVIWLAVENVTPLAIRIFTEWERNPDTYRRYKLRQEANPLPSVNLPIWQLVREFLEQNKKTAHRLDIWNAVREKRPEISEQSVYSYLSKEKYLFVRVGNGYWGLKEWNLEEVERKVRSAGSSLDESPDLPTEIVPLDYILANIASENLVYRILEESSNPLTVDEITERISKILGVNKVVLARATLFDPSDPRFYRQEDGTFTLRKNLEEVIHHLSEKERALKTFLENEIQKLQETMESLTAQHKKEANQLKEEQDILKKLAEEWIEQIEHYEKINSQREKRIKLLSAFLMEATPYVGQDKLEEIFERLNQKSELKDIIGSNEIVKFSKIVNKFLPRLQD